ncbi:hypothetical protein HDV05_006965 [Chytridiales sp. JEL 0842]|nr:hypothetical protein HDV05_006965 [Chytridiales sp. JEL 0842]
MNRFKDVRIGDSVHFSSDDDDTHSDTNEGNVSEVDKRWLEGLTFGSRNHDHVEVDDDAKVANLQGFEDMEFKKKLKRVVKPAIKPPYIQGEVEKQRYSISTDFGTVKERQPSGKGGRSESLDAL